MKKNESSRCIFEIHLEEWNHALHIDGRGHKSDISWLINTLEKYNVHPRIYMLSDWRDENLADAGQLFVGGYGVKTHGKHHYYDEKADRSPYWNQEGLPGFCGGFFFRLLPLWFIKAEIKRTGLFYIHPHDVDENHPIIRNPLLNWKRHVGLKGAKAKLEKLLKEVQFA